MIQVILTKNLKNLGTPGSLVNVKSGYARNYLIPFGFALLATKNNLENAKKESQNLIAHQKTKLDELKAVAKK